MRRAVLLVVVGALLLVPQARGQSAREVAQRTLPSVVLLIMEDSTGQPFSMGSAFFVRDDVVATNVHVVAGASSGYAKPVAASTKLDVVGVVALDRPHDLVLLKIRGANASPLRVVDDSRVVTGDPVYAVGNPQGLQGTFSQGIVSGVRGNDAGRLLQITAPISPGSSGGPILNASGEVVGVAVATYREGQNLNFAVPSSYLLKLLGTQGPTVSLGIVPPEQPSRTAGTGERATNGVIALNFQWTQDADKKYVHSDSDYTFTLRNRLRQTVTAVLFVVIFFGGDDEPVHSQFLSYNQPILAGLAKTIVSANGGYGKDNVPYVGHDIHRLTKRVEVRVLDFRVEQD